MKRILCGMLTLTTLLLGCGSAMAEGTASGHRLLYQGHGSLRIVTKEGKVIYIDPFAGEGYDAAAQTKLSGNTVAQTRAWFETNNPVLRDGQYGKETGSNYIKIGDGTTAWNNLPYVCMPDGYISIEVDDGQGGYEEYGGTALVLEVYDDTQQDYVEV